MDFLWDKITEWLKEMLIGGIVSNLSGMFDATNQKVAEISGQVGLSPQAWNGSIFSMIQNLSETVIVPIAGAILAFVMTLELIQLITDKNNLNDMDTWIAQNADALRDLHIQLKVLVEKEIMNFDVIQVLLSVDPVITSAYFWFNFPALSRRTEFLRTWNREKVIPFQKRSVVF